MLFVAEGVVPPSQLHNPFRDTFGGLCWTDLRPSAMCRCGGQYLWSPKDHANVCGGSRRYRRGADGSYVEWEAPSCGAVEPGQAFQHGEARRETSYNPNHHLNTWLLRLKGIEDADIPPYFLRLVRRELRRVGVVPAACCLEDLNEAMERLTAERIVCRPMYEHRILIFRMLRGADNTLRLTDAECEQIRIYFRDFIRVYDTLPGDLRRGRTSKIEYSYTIFMICLILGYDHVLPWLPLVRSQSIIDEYNEIFAEVCRRLGWPLANLSRSSVWAAK